MRTILLNGLPTSLLVELIERGYDNVEFELKNVEWLRETLNTSLEIINTIRHESTKNLVLSLVENKQKVKEIQFISLNDIRDDDIVVIIAPKKLQERGKEMEVKWEDLAIIRLSYIGVIII